MIKLIYFINLFCNTGSTKVQIFRIGIRISNTRNAIIGKPAYITQKTVLPVTINGNF